MSIKKGGERMTLAERCENMMQELGIPTTKFCQRIKLSRSGYYAWKTGSKNLSDTTLERIETYLSNYGF